MSIQREAPTIDALFGWMVKVKLLERVRLVSDGKGAAGA
jgi:hypothetical protein